MKDWKMWTFYEQREKEEIGKWGKRERLQKEIYFLYSHSKRLEKGGERCETRLTTGGGYSIITKAVCSRCAADGLVWLNGRASHP